jgi:hypothetical protein
MVEKDCNNGHSSRSLRKNIKTIKIHWGYKAATVVHFRNGFWALPSLGRGHIAQH